MRPQEVTAPRENWQTVDVLCDMIPGLCGYTWSLAVGRQRTEVDGVWRWREVLVTRWDGKGDRKGFPVSSGHACWHVIPDELYEMYLSDAGPIPAEKRAWVRAFLGLNNQRNRLLEIQTTGGGT
jgi:hypothetical protein